mgnify:CR=1 FL=1
MYICTAKLLSRAVTRPTTMGLFSWLKQRVFQDTAACRYRGLRRLTAREGVSQRYSASRFLFAGSQYAVSMKEQIVTLYRCDFCKKKSLRKHSMLAHERFCQKNPDNVPHCFRGANGCKHFDRRSWTCEYLGSHLHTLRSETFSRHNILEGSIRMPFSCDGYEKADTE